MKPNLIAVAMLSVAAVTHAAREAGAQGCAGRFRRGVGPALATVENDPECLRILESNAHQLGKGKKLLRATQQRRH